MNANRWRSLALAAIGFLGVGCSSGSGNSETPVPVSAGGEMLQPDGEVWSPPIAQAPGYEGLVPAELQAMDAEPPTAAAMQPSSGAAARPVRVATNSTQPAQSQATTPPPTAAVDAPVQRDLIIYTAEIMLAIYEVDATERALAAAATEIGGFVATLDARTLVVRIPAAQFNAFLTTIEGAGQVLGRRIQAEDVTEQFRDIQIRLENLTAMRNRLEAMLARAANVQDAIQVERELERVTVELESLRGRLRFLADRVAYSTITIRFQPLPREQLAGNVPTQLPVPWLQTLGLSTLMR